MSRRQLKADSGTSSCGIARGLRGPRDSLNVVIVGAWMRFPHGMADTSRARLLARALFEAGTHALLISSFDDVRSRARFPTKIAEYLASARPVATIAVGEMPPTLPTM